VSPTQIIRDCLPHDNDGPNSKHHTCNHHYTVKQGVSSGAISGIPHCGQRHPKNALKHQEEKSHCPENAARPAGSALWCGIKKAHNCDGEECSIPRAEKDILHHPIRVHFSLSVVKIIPAFPIRADWCPFVVKPSPFQFVLISEIRVSPWFGAYQTLHSKICRPPRLMA
jgi:hypothetical protein